MVRPGSTAYAVLAAAMGCVLSLCAGTRPAHAADERAADHGKLQTIGGCRVLSLDGTPEQMGAAHGKLLGAVVRRVVRDLITEGFGRDAEAYRNILAGAKVMEAHQPAEYIAELKALAAAAEVAYDDILLLQCFGDVRRCIRGAGSAPMCTSFAILPPLAREGTCIVGRNLDYFDHGVGEYASLLAHYRPQGKLPFVTITWAGIINGWTLLNAKGIVVSNNTSFSGRDESLEGIATCFLLRYVAERADTVDAGVRIVREARRTCGTNMLVASGRPPDAVLIEYDHGGMAVRRPVNGFVGGANDFRRLYQDNPEAVPLEVGRVATALALARERAGAVDLDCNIAAAEGVPIEGMNLHSVMIDATNLRFRVAMGSIPACKLPPVGFRLTDQGLAADPAAAKGPAQAADAPPSPEARALAREIQHAPARPGKSRLVEITAVLLGAVMMALAVVVSIRLVHTAFTGKTPMRWLDEPRPPPREKEEESRDG